MSNDGDLTFNHNTNNFDAWLVKMKADGQIQWQKCMGGTDWDYAEKTIQTQEGGYIMVGTTRSYDGDLFTIKNHAGSDAWVVKLKPNGESQWAKAYGTDNFDIARSIQPTADGGYLVAGTSQSSYWLFKIDSVGSLLWEKHFGGSGDEQLGDMQLTNDNGCIMTGSSWSGDIPGHHGIADFADYWVVKVDSLGLLQWHKSLGGSFLEQSNCIIQTQDGGYLVSGFSYSNNGDVSGHHGSIGSSQDPWIVKLDSTGKISWQKSLGGTLSDNVWHLSSTIDGDVILAGNAVSNDGTLPGSNQGNGDAWLLKMGLDGTTKWQQLLGSSKFDQARAVTQTMDGGFLFCGYAGAADGDVTHAAHSINEEDIWVVKLGHSTFVTEQPDNTLSLYPNPASENIHLTMLEDDPFVSVFITDLLGKQTLRFRTDRLEDLNVSSLPAGTYFVQAETKSGRRLVGKILKQ